VNATCILSVVVFAAGACPSSASDSLEALLRDADAACALAARVEFGAPREPLSALSDLVRAALDEPEARREVSRRLADLALSPEATLEARAFACRELAIAGGAEEAKRLAALLGDEALGDFARLALEAIPDREAESALRAGLGRLEGRALVGVVNSLGEKRDPASIDALLPLAASADRDLAAAAAAALAKIDGRAAAVALGPLLDASKGSSGPIDAALAAAEALALANRRPDSASLAEKLLRDDRPARVRTAALRVLLLARDGRAAGLVADAIAGDDEHGRASALRFVREVAGEDLSAAFCSTLGRLDPRPRADLVEALGHRRDAAAVAAEVEALADADASVRAAASRALGRNGGAAAALPLARAAAAAPPDEKAAPREALARLSDESADAALLAALAAGEPPAVRVEVVAALGRRRTAGALPVLARALKEAAEPEETLALETALASIALRIGDPRVSAPPLLEASASGPPASRAAALRVLGSVGGEHALAALRAALSGEDGPLHDAAVLGLASFPDAAARPDLESLAGRPLDPAAHRLVIEALVRLAGTGSDAVPLLDRALALARDDEARRLVVSGFGRAASAKAFSRLAPLLPDAMLGFTARAAAAALAESIADREKEPARSIASRLLALEALEAEPRRIATETLAKIERLDDYFTRWLVSGPYSVDGKGAAEVFAEAFPPEAFSEDARWRRIETSADHGSPWLVDLARHLGGENRAAYLWTRFHAPRDVAARLEIGSDDGVKAWLDGRLVHENPAFRGVQPGQDVAPIALDAGWHDLVLKVVQGGGGWAACARVRDADGRHLEGLEDAWPDAEPGFEPLFDGESLMGFVVMGRESGFSVRDGAIVSEGGQGGLWLRTPRTYADFVLRLEWRITKNGNSGVFVRAAEALEPWITGHEIQISNEPRGDLHCTGSLYGTVAAHPRPDEAEEKWHEIEILCDGPRITVAVDGTTTVDVAQDDVPAIASKPRSGFIGLQDSHAGPGSLVAFRNVRVKELSPEGGGQFRVLVFSKTAGFRHASIGDGIAMIRALGDRFGFDVDATENANVFRADRLRRYRAVVFLNTTGDVLDPGQEIALERYVRKGGGWVGIHSAADTEYDWPFYEELVGARFRSHPAVQEAAIRVEDRRHRATAHLGAAWRRTDEWYDYGANPRGEVHVLLSLDEGSYDGGRMGSDHPISWWREVGEGRAFYTGLGHTRESYGEPDYARHVLGAILWAARIPERHSPGGR